MTGKAGVKQLEFRNPHGCDLFAAMPKVDTPFDDLPQHVVLFDGNHEWRLIDFEVKEGVLSSSMYLRWKRFGVRTSTETEQEIVFKDGAVVKWYLHVSYGKAELQTDIQDPNDDWDDAMTELLGLLEDYAEMKEVFE